MVGRARSWEPGTWSEPSGRPRVLLEDPDGAIRAVGTDFLLREGYDVAVCGGPEEMGRRTCPLVTTGHCGLSEGADVVYTSLRWSDPGSRDVLKALRAQHPRVPVVVEISRPDADRFEEDLVGCSVVHMPAGRAAMLAAIRDALARNDSAELHAPS